MKVTPQKIGLMMAATVAGSEPPAPWLPRWRLAGPAGS